MSNLEKRRLERGVMKKCQRCENAKFQGDFADGRVVCTDCEYAERVRQFTNPSRITVPRKQPNGWGRKNREAVAAGNRNRPKPESRPPLLRIPKDEGLPSRWI